MALIQPQVYAPPNKVAEFIKLYSSTSSSVKLLKMTRVNYKVTWAKIINGDKNFVTGKSLEDISQSIPLAELDGFIIKGHEIKYLSIHPAIRVHNNIPLEKRKRIRDEMVSLTAIVEGKAYNDIIEIKQKNVYSKSSHLNFNREQTQIFLGLPGFAFNQKNDLYLKILTSYLSGQSSPLFVKVRDEMGLCYAVD